MRVAAAILASAILVSTIKAAHVPTVEEFDDALRKHHKSHGMDDNLDSAPRPSRAARQQALAKSAAVIEEHNTNPHRSYTMKWNAMSDLTDNEYIARLKTMPDAVVLPHHHRQHDSRVLSSIAADFPRSVDWSTKDGGKYVTPIKNQGTCGSCWAFTGAAVVESMVAIATNTRAIPLSVEQILTCSGGLQHVQSEYPNRMISSSKGCDGGMTFLAYEYLKRTPPHGLTCDADMPYRMKLKTDAFDAARCTNVRADTAWDATSSYLSLQNNEHAIVAALQNGPIAVSIDASGNGFRHYGSGVYDAADCKSDGVYVDHAVIVVGYGDTSAGEPYWIIRNSWGSMWGERGYMRMKRGGTASPSGPCNLFLYASQPTGLKGQPDATCAAPLPPSDTSLSALAFWPTNLEQGSLLYGVSVAVVVLGVGMHIYGEHRMRVNFPKQTYVESFMRNQLPTQSQVLMHMAARKAKAAIQSV
ncbi:Aste57867_13536 [Aphanomyces stellatus]|uniref:Aste57867_13536 protein n=1 Tax=Aphanomyces stellatus TaxID=120398 RepID=A0A485L038_9STRA|nr:hypothetical protein As57867_013486 [Aphanomyces stellatus]VFT90374.1 Aste57867_13536 [Aphanomyces stellatus]